MVTFEAGIEDISESTLARFLARARRAVGLRGQVNVVITTDRKMRELNRQFRKKNKPTDVLSFPAPTQLAGRLAGDIAISGRIATLNASAIGHKPSAELKVLVLHGLLHLAGFDHENDNGEMARKERKLRQELGLPDSLIERAASRDRSGQRRHASQRRKSGSSAVSSHSREAASGGSQ